MNIPLGVTFRKDPVRVNTIMIRCDIYIQAGML